MMVPSEHEGRSATRQVRVRRARKTHQELYDAVMSRFNSATTSHQQLRRARKTHEELRTELTTQKGQLDVLRIDTTPTGRKLPARTERSPPDSRNITTVFEASLSVKPSEIRRAGSLNRGLQSLAGNAAAVGQPLRRFASISDQSTSSHSRHNSTTRSPLSSAEPPSDSTANEESSSPMRKKPARRDSIVLEKARHWGAPGEFDYCVFHMEDVVKLNHELQVLKRQFLRRTSTRFP